MKSDDAPQRRGLHGTGSKTAVKRQTGGSDGHYGHQWEILGVFSPEGSLHWHYDALHLGPVSFILS